MKKIMIINGYLDIGGAERVLTYLANTLCDEYEVTFVTLQKSEAKLFLLKPKVKVHQLNLEEKRKSAKEMGIWGTINYYRNTCKVIRCIVEKESVDLVITFNDREVYLTWWALRKNKKVKLLYSQRNAPSSKPNHTNSILRFIYHHCDAVVFQLKAVQKFYKMDNNNSEVIANPVIIKNNCDYVVKREKRIISAGRLTEQKRFDILIKAFNIFSLKHNDYRLDIFGSGHLKEELQGLIDDRNLGEKVAICDPIPDVMLVNKSADMFVLSSDYEGIPNVLLEAMAVKIPCISTNCVPGGARMATDNGKNGILVGCRDVEGLARAMDEYATSDKLKERNANSAYDFIESNFSEEKIIYKWKSYIGSIIEGSKAKCCQ